MRQRFASIENRWNSTASLRAHLQEECAKHSRLSTQQILGQWNAEQNLVLGFLADRPSDLENNIVTYLQP